MTALGIDPGTGGAVAVFDQFGALLAIHDMPVLCDGPKGRSTVNAALLASIVRQTKATKAYCELVGPRPGEGAVGAFSFGRCRGVVEGVLGACGVPCLMIAPPVWKRAAGIAPGREHKDSARAAAITLWPAHAALFARKRDVARSLLEYRIKQSWHSVKRVRCDLWLPTWRR